MGGPRERMGEVKFSDWEGKDGGDPAEVSAVIEAIRGCANLKLTGLMTIPPWDEDAEKSRPYFARLRELASAHGLTGLSMGRSNDLEVAIQEGSTIVRLGTALFGGRPKA